MKNQNNILVVAISLLIMAIILIYIQFVYLPTKEDEIKNLYVGKYREVGVFYVEDEKGIPKGTLINSQLFSQGSISVKKIPYMYLPKSSDGKILIYYTESNIDVDSAKTSFEEKVMGRMTTRMLSMGEFLSDRSFEEVDLQKVDHYSRQIEIEINNTVGDELKVGRVVDIIVSYGNGDYDTVVVKKTIEKIMGLQQTDANGKPIQTAAGDKAKILFSVKESEYRDIEFAKKLGDLQVRMYINPELQVESDITFNYEEMRRKALEIAAEMKLVGDIKKYYETAYLDISDKVNINARFKNYVENQIRLIEQQERAANQNTGTLTNNQAGGSMTQIP